MTGLFLAAITLWVFLGLVRFVDPYNPASRFQRWRRWDVFHLVPFGAFFGPSVPEHEAWILMRTLQSEGQYSRWRAVPRISERRIWHTVFNPGKPTYTARFSAAHGVLAAARLSQQENGQLSNRFLMSDAYLRVLRYVSDCACRDRPAQAVQFAVVEIDLATGKRVQSVLSGLHELNHAAT